MRRRSFSLFVFALLLSLGGVAEAQNGNVQIRRTAWGVQIRISDPDGVLEARVYAGTRRVQRNREALKSGHCAPVITISLPGAAHWGHQHLVWYADCQNPPVIETWLFPADLGDRRWHRGRRINLSFNYAVESSSKCQKAAYYMKAEDGVLKVMLRNAVPVTAGTLCFSPPEGMFVREDSIQPGPEFQGIAQLWRGNDVVDAMGIPQPGAVLIDWNGDVEVDGWRLEPGTHEIFSVQLTSDLPLPSECGIARFLKFFQSGPSALLLSDVVFDVNENALPAATVDLSLRLSPDVVRSDANLDGTANLVDVVDTLRYVIFGAPLPCASAADVNGDNNVDINDPILSLRSIFAGVALPPRPLSFGFGANSPSAGLGCESYPSGTTGFVEACGDANESELLKCFPVETVTLSNQAFGNVRRR